MLQTFKPEDSKAIGQLWNSCLGKTHPLSEDVIEQKLTSKYFDADLLLLVKENKHITGFIWGKAAKPTWADPKQAYLCALCVHPKMRGKGVGNLLFQTLIAKFKSQGYTQMRIGGEPDRLVPGIPLDIDLASWRFLLKRGIKLTQLVFDLHLDLRDISPAKLATPYYLSDKQTPTLHTFLANYFPGRWQDEVNDYKAQGIKILSLHQQTELIGFACIFYQDPYIGPSLYWQNALAEKTAGLGPIGLSPEQRGLGLGTGLFLSAAQYLKTLGAQHLIIDWTNLLAFYSKFGAHIWRSYQSATLALDA